MSETKFKVGDPVRLKEEFRHEPYREKLKNGERCIITGFSQDGKCAEIDGSFGAMLDRLELVSPAPALIQMGGEYQTRDGRKVRVLAVDGKHKDFPVTALVTCRNGNEWPLTFTADGHEIIGWETENDLIPVPPKPKEYEGWVNLYPNGRGSDLHPDKATADASADNMEPRIACLHLKFTEGEGLDAK